MSALVSSTTTTAAAAASNAATLYAVLLEKCGPAAAAAAGWAQERYLLFVDAAVLRFDDGLALLDPAQANYVRDVAAASQDVVASLARFLASLWALAGLVVVPAAVAVALFRRQPEEWQLAEVGVLLFLYALWRFRRWVRTSETLRAVAAVAASVASGEPGAAAVYYRTREQLRQRKPKPKLKFWAVVGACWFCRGAAHALPFAPSDFRSSKLGSVAAAGAERGRWPCLAEPRRSAGELAFAALAAIAGRWAPPDDRPPPPSPRSAARRRRVVAPRRTAGAATLAPGTLLETALGDRYAGLRDHVAEVASDADGWRAAAVGCFSGHDRRAVARGAVAVGFGVPVLATLRCVRAARDGPRRREDAPLPRLLGRPPYFRGAQRPTRAQAKLADVARRMRD
ncbi:hypothetical protein JL722_12614 [Aureococcus anophagefferens]|nr:hypothetical protein JL722_12614 [Aureococcus anophagefferens]